MKREMEIIARNSRVLTIPALKPALKPFCIVSPSMEVILAGPETAFWTFTPLKRILMLLKVMVIIFMDSTKPSFTEPVKFFPFRSF